MSFPVFSRRSGLLPRSLFGRLTLILLFGLIAAHALSFGLIVYERTMAGKAMMIGFAASDVASSVAILERVPPAERAEWLGRLERKNYRYVLGPVLESEPVQSMAAREVIAAVSAVLGPRYPIRSSAPRGDSSGKRINFHANLADGTPLTIELVASAMPLSPWLPLILALQLAILIAATGMAVRLATRPLARLAHAADTLGPDLRTAPLPEDGPLEVARAATAFNAMQRRIADYLAERMQILAAVSHDLQTPITRMRLRVDMMEKCDQTEKILGDLATMQVLVEEGISYARNAQGIVEPVQRTDLDALLASLIYDYQDAGQALQLTGRVGQPLAIRPHTLRRIVANLIDNALKFGSGVEVAVNANLPDHVSISVLDRGPGIAQHELKSVMQPFYRVESSRNRDTGGTGLGLAIAQQLAVALGGSLILANRDGGGLEACLTVPAR